MFDLASSNDAQASHDIEESMSLLGSTLPARPRDTPAWKSLRFVLAVVTYVAIGCVGYNYLDHSNAVTTTESLLSITDELGCKNMDTSNLNGIKAGFSACSNYLTTGTSVPICIGDAGSCGDSNKSKSLTGALSLSSGVSASATGSASTAGTVTMAGTFGFGTFMYVFGRLASGSDAAGDTMRNLLGPLKSLALDGTLSFTLGAEQTVKASTAGFEAEITGAVSVQNNIGCNDPLSCVLKSMVAKSPSDGYTKLGGLNFYYKFAVEDLTAPDTCEAEAGIVLEPTTVVKNKVWLRDLDGVGPRIYTRIAKEGVKVEPTLGMVLPVDVCVQNCKSATPYNLLFQGELETTGTVLAGTVSMFGWWRNAFGIPILHLADLRVGLAVPVATPTVINAFAPGGRFCLGKQKVCTEGAAGSQIAGATYLGINFDPEANENYIFVALSATSLNILLSIFEEGMNFPKLRDAIPKEILNSGLFPYKKSKTCTPGQLLDFVNNLDCFATMSFNSPGADAVEIPTSVGTLEIPKGVGLSAAISFLGVNLYLKAEICTDIDNMSIKLNGNMDVVNLKGVLIFSESKANQQSGPFFSTNCKYLSCVVAQSGFIRIPAVALEGEASMTVKPEGSLGITTHRYNFASRLFGAYDVAVAGMFDNLRTKMSVDMQVTSTGDLGKKLAARITAYIQQLDQVMQSAVANGEQARAAITSTLQSTCSQAFSGTPEFALGPVEVKSISQSARIQFRFKCCAVVNIKWDSPSYTMSCCGDVTLMPRTSASLQGYCNQAVSGNVNHAGQLFDFWIGEMRKWKDDALKVIGNVGAIDSYFQFNEFNFAIAYNLLDVSGQMRMALDMKVGPNTVKFNQGVGFNVDVEALIFDHIKSAVFSKIPDPQAIINGINGVVPTVINGVKDAANKNFNARKNEIQNTFNAQKNAAASKMNDYANGAKNAVISACRNSIGGKGWPGSAKNKARDLCNRMF